MKNSLLTSPFHCKSRKESKRAEIQNHRLSGNFGYDSSEHHYRQGYHLRQPVSFRYGNIEIYKNLIYRFLYLGIEQAMALIG
jgi:hypothetical protein